jgi:hypothetical protein
VHRFYAKITRETNERNLIIEDKSKFQCDEPPWGVSKAGVQIETDSVKEQKRHSSQDVLAYPCVANMIHILLAIEKSINSIVPSTNKQMPHEQGDKLFLKAFK